MRAFFFDYIKQHISILYITIINYAIFFLVFYLYQLPFEAVLYPVILSSVINIAFFLYLFCRSLWSHQRISSFLCIDQIRNFTKPHALYPPIKKDFYHIMDIACTDYADLESRYDSSFSQMLNYFTLWIHQIKTPIASMHLMLEHTDSPTSRKLNSELIHIEHYVDMVLTYIRSESDQTDYVFESIDLNKLITSCIKDLRGDFILKKLQLNYEPLEKTIITDGKWFAFVITQILSNALKYTPNGSISIYLENDNVLCIKDTGIGIAPSDLPRIFDKGYSGFNGHSNPSSSGLGLFLCKKICSNLHLDISAESTVNVGTTIRISLDQFSNLTKM